MCRGNRTTLAVLACLPLTACSVPEPEVSLRSDDPVGRSIALTEAVRAGDQSAVPDVIGLLESDDPAVRMLAIAALEDLTGKRLGYEAFAPEQDRQAAVQRWRAAWASGELSR